MSNDALKNPHLSRRLHHLAAHHPDQFTWLGCGKCGCVYNMPLLMPCDASLMGLVMKKIHCPECFGRLKTQFVVWGEILEKVGIKTAASKSDSLTLSMSLEAPLKKEAPNEH